MQISNTDLKFLSRLEKSQLPIWRKWFGIVLIVFSGLIAVMLVLGTVAGARRDASAKSDWWFPITALLVGMMQLQELKYQRIIRYLQGKVKADIPDGGKGDTHL